MRTNTVALCLAALVASCAAASPPVGWRGDGTGRYPDSEAPKEWSAERNVLWFAETSEWSNTMPTIVGDRIFITAEPATLICLDASDGSVLWQAENDYESILREEELARAEKARELNRELSSLRGEHRRTRREAERAEDEPEKAAELAQQVEKLQEQVDELQQRLASYREYLKPDTHGTNGYSSATVVSDGRYVHALFGIGVAVSYDMEGNRRWARRVDKPRSGWGHSASPVLADGKLIVHVTDVVALNTDDGEEIWRTPAKASFGTPVVASADGGDVIITPRGDFIRASDGEKLGSVAAGLEYNSPVIQDGVVYFVANQRGRATAVKLPEKPEPFDAEPLWQVDITRNRYYGSPVYRDGRIYAVTQSHQLTVLDASNGEAIYEMRIPDMPGLVYSSITMTRNALLISTERGATVLLAPGDEYEELGRGRLDTFRSTPVFDSGRMYIRTRSGLYCIAPEDN